MTTKEYLKSYKNLLYKIEDLEREIEELEEQITSVSSLLGDGMPRGSGVSSKLDRLMPLLVDKKKHKEELKAEAIMKRLEIEEVIDEIKDEPISCRLLKDKYIRAMTWGETTEDLGYANESYVAGPLHKKALRLATEVMQARQ